MSKKIAFIFPGQGSQVVGMLSELATHYPVIEETFATASQALGFDLWQLTQQGSAEQLNQTQFTQPALLAASFALWRLWKNESATLPIIIAGHSLGEYSALVCAETIEFSAAIRLVAERGRLMQEAIPDGKGAMAAIVGLEDSVLQELCTSLAQGQILSPANYNSISQTVVAGNTEAVDRLVEKATLAGAKLAKRIPVSVPSHCMLMKPAAEHLTDYLHTVTFLPPQIPFINNVDVKIEEKPAAIKDALVRQLFSPVRWVEIIQHIEKQNVAYFIECGPGKILAGLNKRITHIPTLSIYNLETFKNALIA